VRRRLRCRGAVQGVGFRPCVHRLATSLGLSGAVKNDPDGATVEVEGRADLVRQFEQRLGAGLPPLARLDSVEGRQVHPRGGQDFVVAESVVEARRGARIPPDSALCSDCRRELDDPSDRRYRYPFTTCTNCGPRYSLVYKLPYDRERTSMAGFRLCPECEAEYHDVADRRYHAEPICCPACGPELRLIDVHGDVLGCDGDALAEVRRQLVQGAVIAVHGIGGFQIACRADLALPLEQIRRNKQRRCKPFAVMVRDVETAARVAELSEADLELLASPAGPIVLAPRKSGAGILEDVAPGLADIGVLLPTTPLHVELFRDAPYDVLVMTSGNAKGEPICRTEAEARARLSSLVDGLLVHDREVVRRVDDSVVRATARGPVFVRRSRGYVPVPLPLPVAVNEPVLALGGYLQTVACVAVGDQAFPTQHVGDLDTEAAREFLVEAATTLEEFLEATATRIVCDEHPDYPSTWIAAKLADEREASACEFQHHLAHAAAVLGEHLAFPEPGKKVGAVVLDGTGHGPDGTSWGGEVLVIDGTLAWERRARCEPIPLVGGYRAVEQPWRVAVAALIGAGIDPLDHLSLRVSDNELQAVASLARLSTWPLASGAGRVFEAAGVMLGLCVENTYEGEAAARLEALASAANVAVGPWPEVELDRDAVELPTSKLLGALGRRIVEGEDRAEIALGFHASFASLLAELVGRSLHGIGRVACGGGCFVNRILAAELENRLSAAGFDVLMPCRLPPGDGGLAYGQAVLAAVGLARSCVPVFEGGP